MLEVNIRATIGVSVIIAAACAITGMPWWFFVIPVMLFGALVTKTWKWKVNAFWVGFTAGFLTWAGSDLYFNMAYGMLLLSRMSILMAMPGAVIISLTGIIGGILAGLAFYTGKSIVADKQRPEPDIDVPSDRLS